MLSKIVIKNFKPIGEKGVALDLRPLTLLVGPNGSGKSSILEAIALMAQSVGHSALLHSGGLLQYPSIRVYHT